MFHINRSQSSRRTRFVAEPHFQGSKMCYLFYLLMFLIFSCCRFIMKKKKIFLRKCVSRPYPSHKLQLESTQCELSWPKIVRQTLNTYGEAEHFCAAAVCAILTFCIFNPWLKGSAAPDPYTLQCKVSLIFGAVNKQKKKHLILWGIPSWKKST